MGDNTDKMEFLLRVAAGVITTLKEDLTKRNTTYAQQKRSAELSGKAV